MKSKSLTYGGYALDVTETHTKDDSYTSGCCPICGDRFESTIEYGNVKFGILATKGKIVVHMRIEHKIEDENAKNT